MELFITADRIEGKMSYKPLSLRGGHCGPILLMRKLRLTESLRSRTDGLLSRAQSFLLLLLGRVFSPPGLS